MRTDESRLRLLQVIAPAPFGGAESVARGLALAYPGEGLIAALNQHGGAQPFIEQLRAEQIPVAELICGRRRYDREVAALERLVRQHRPDVIQTHVYHSDFVGYFAARRCGIPIVCHMHGITGGDRKDRFYQWLDLLLVPRFDGVICVSEELRVRLTNAGCDPSHVYMVPNPYTATALLSRTEARAKLGIASERPAIGWIGRMREEKGVDLFLKAFARVPQPRPLAVLVGDGVDMPIARRLAAELGLEHDVHFAGEQPNAGSLVQAFDAIAISSRNEGLPMVLLEAMGAGVPPVAFALGGIPDAVDESTGWVVPAGNLAALADAMTRVVSDPAERQRRGVAGVEQVRALYGREKWGARIHEIHREIVARGARSAEGRKTAHV